MECRAFRKGFISIFVRMLCAVAFATIISLFVGTEANAGYYAAYNTAYKAYYNRYIAVYVNQATLGIDPIAYPFATDLNFSGTFGTYNRLDPATILVESYDVTGNWTHISDGRIFPDINDPDDVQMYNDAIAYIPYQADWYARTYGYLYPPDPVTESHGHIYSWKTITDPTADSDGVEVLSCNICGDVKDMRAISAMVAFEAETKAKIMNAPAGGTVVIESKIWNTFGPDVRDALIARPDVTLKTSFLSEGYKGTPLKISASAKKLVPLFDKNGYLGLLRAGYELGYDK